MPVTGQVLCLIPEFFHWIEFWTVAGQLSEMETFRQLRIPGTGLKSGLTSETDKALSPCIAVSDLLQEATTLCQADRGWELELLVARSRFRTRGSPQRSVTPALRAWAKRS